jgi:redox-sensitive bicupin YhaK (pirin superfamily)
MMTTSGAKIFLSSERGYHEVKGFRSYRTFNFGTYRHEHKTAFGPLYVLNDDTLAGGRSIRLSTEADSDILLLPVVGAIRYTESNGHSNIIEAGQAQLCSTSAGTVLEISNPYKKDLVNFLQFRIRSHADIDNSKPVVQCFSLDKNRNSLLELFPKKNQAAVQDGLLQRTFIGKFSGRYDAVFKTKDLSDGIFVYIIEGAFEVQNRLMEARDGLALWDVDELNFEALSNDAIILLMEVPLPIQQPDHYHL